MKLINLNWRSLKLTVWIWVDTTKIVFPKSYFVREEGGFKHRTESHYLIHTGASWLLLMYWPLNWRNIMLFTSIQTMMLLLFMALMGADAASEPVTSQALGREQWNTKHHSGWWNEIRKQDTTPTVSGNYNLNVCFVLRPNVWWHLVTRSNHQVWRGGGF